MKIRHLWAIFAFCTVMLAWMPAVGSPCEQPGRSSTAEPAVNVQDSVSPAVPAIGRDGWSAPPSPTARTQAVRGGILHIGEPLTIRSLRSGSPARSIAAEIARLNELTPPARRSMGLVRQANSPHRNWIQRHPVLFGTLVGFGAGFLIGYLPGDDAVLEDFTAGFNGLVLGGVGAGAGAVAGWVASR